MEVTSPNVAMLTNYEVYSVIREVQSKPRDKEAKKKLEGPLQNMRTIAYETVKYIDKQTTCTLQSQQVIESFLREAAPFNLTKAEKLQCLNLRPTTEVEILLVIEESEERFTEEQVEQLLEIIRRTIPGNDEDEEEEEVEEGTDRAAEAPSETVAS